MSCISIDGIDASNSSTIWLIPRSRIHFVMVVAPIDSFKILTTYGCFFCSTFFLVILELSISGIIVSGVIEEADIVEVGAELFLINSHPPK